MALPCSDESGLPTIATMSFRPLITQCTDGHTPAECAKVMGEHGAIAVGANCEQEPRRMTPLLREMRAAVNVPLAAQPAAFRTTDDCHCFTRHPAFPDDLETIQVSRREVLEFGKLAKSEGIGYAGGWLTSPGVRTLMVAGGNTPLELYRRMAEQRLPLSHLTVFALDEYVGVPLEEPRNCANLLRDSVAAAWGIPRFFAISSLEQEALASVQALERRIANAGGIDAVVLGLGPNGHLRFN